MVCAELSLKGLSVLNIITESSNGVIEMNSRRLDDVRQMITQSCKPLISAERYSWILDNTSHLILRKGKFWDFLERIDILYDILPMPIEKTFYYKNSNFISLPSTEFEAMASRKELLARKIKVKNLISAILGPIEKINLTKMYKWIVDFNKEDPRTYSKILNNGLTTENFDVVFKKFSLTSRSTQVII